MAVHLRCVKGIPASTAEPENASTAIACTGWADTVEGNQE